MSVDLHRQVEELTAQAERLDAAGDRAGATQLYLQAAERESHVYEGVPRSRPRTRGIIAVSVVSLLWRAGAHAEVVRMGQKYLTEPELPAFARAQIGDLLVNRDPAQPPTATPVTSAMGD